MMGRLKSDQGQLFYEFHLSDAVPEDHLVRKIDTALDLSWLRSELAPQYSSMGRPSIDPELMIRMLVVGYVFAIRSERLLCREVQVNLAYRWFCRLGIEDAIPDHSEFWRARNERFREGEVFRRVFERVVEACIASGLVGGEGFAVDASLIAADANKQRSIAGQDWRRDRDPAKSSRRFRHGLGQRSWNRDQAKYRRRHVSGRRVGMGLLHCCHETRGSRRAPCCFDRGCWIVDCLFASIRLCYRRAGAERAFVRHCVAGHHPGGHDCNRRTTTLWTSGRHSRRNGWRGIPSINSGCGMMAIPVLGE